MQENNDIENLFRSQLSDTNSPNRDAIWAKLDTDLEPIRLAYRKERKRSAIVYWTTAAILAIGGGSLWYYMSGQEGSQTKNNHVDYAVAEKKSCCSKPTIADRFGIGENPLADQNNNVASAEATNTDVTNDPKEIRSTNNDITTSKNKPNAVVATNVAETNRTVFNNTRTTSKKTNAAKIIAPDVELTSKNKDKVVAADSDVTNITAVDNLSSTTNQINNSNNILAQAADKVVDAPTAAKLPAAPVDNKNSVDKTKDAIITDAKPFSKTTIPTEVTKKLSVLGGVNFTSSFNKPSYFGGGQLQLGVKNKLIFVGLKVSKNDIDHQLISSDKAGTNPTMADAVIQKMTTIQMPFGYQFALNKKQNNSTLLNLGFEPTLLTGIKTVYYDNNGVPGGPTTPVINSPLINQAINKFNLSFIAGVQRRIGRRSSLFANVGYGLINITDKQFYNKVGSSNNLRYAQLGVGFDLTK